MVFKFPMLNFPGCKFSGVRSFGFHSVDKIVRHNSTLQAGRFTSAVQGYTVTWIKAWKLTHAFEQWWEIFRLLFFGGDEILPSYIRDNKPRIPVIQQPGCHGSCHVRLLNEVWCLDIDGFFGVWCNKYAPDVFHSKSEKFTESQESVFTETSRLRCIFLVFCGSQNLPEMFKTVAF